MTIYDFEVTAIDGTPRRMNDYRGRVLLVVNVASRCGYTPQYAGLERLHRTHRDQGLVVLGFPCDQFGHQEPGTDAEIEAFCTDTYDITFPMFAKIDVNGPRAHPLYGFLKHRQRGLLGTTSIKWNFTKFLVGRAGDVLGRYGSADTPETIEADVVSALGA
jgi:glutathione peroxidase